MPWVAPQLQAHAQPGQLVRAFGRGPPPHARTQHRPARPPQHRSADASRSVPIAGGEMEAGPAQRRTAGHTAGFGQGVSRALSTPRPHGYVAGQPRTAPPRPADALRAARIADGGIELGTAVWRGARCRPNHPPRPELQPITGGGEELSGRRWVQAAPPPARERPRRMGLHGRACALTPYSPKPPSPSPGAPRSGSRRSPPYRPAAPGRRVAFRTDRRR